MKISTFRCRSRILLDKDSQKIVRLGTKSDDEFIQILNKKIDKIQELFLAKIKKLTRTVTVKGMLGDSTITDLKTFDPMLVQEFYKNITEKLHDWTTQNISISNNEDLRRIFVKFEVKNGNYLLSCHMSIQYHVLLFYKPDSKVIKYQKELSEILDKTKNTETKLAKDNDQYIIKKLKDLGFNDLNYKELFQIFYKNDNLREKIYKELDEKADISVQDLFKRKKHLFNELDNLLIEAYQTTPVLIDDSKLVAGEEGCLCIFDLEFIKNNIKEGMFDPKKIPVKIKEKLFDRLDEIIKIITI